MKRLVGVTLLALMGISVWAQEPTVESLTKELNAARRKLVDWGGMNVYGSDDSEIPAP